MSESTPFVLTHQSRKLEAHGAQLTLSLPVADGLLAAASRALGTAGRGALLVGALPFDRGSPARLLVPEETLCSFVRAPVLSERLAPVAAVPWRVTERPTREGYHAAVRRALERLAAAPASGSPALTKVVLARMLELEAPQRIEPLQVFARLLADTRASAFCVPLDPRPDGAARTLVGASPELLVDKHGTKVASLPMAGSAPRQADPAADREAARTLAESAKDRREHRVVVEHVLDILAPHCHQLRAPELAILSSTATMWHLATPIEGDLKRDISSLELAAALHPTPAVCGSPTDQAYALIGRLEPFDRNYFTGTVGWCDAHGDGRWMVSIRCAEIAERTALLYAGAGIVAGSDPEAEAAETSAKFRTLLRALGIDECGRPLAAGAPLAADERP